MYRLCWGWEWCGGAKDYWLDGDYKASDSPIEFEAIEGLIDHLLKPKNISKLHKKVISRRKSKQECELFVEDGEGVRGGIAGGLWNSWGDEWGITRWIAGRLA